MISLLFLIVVAGVTVLAEEAGHFEWAVLWLLFSIWARLMVIDETLREVR